jgi:hypothetical protein
MGRFSLCNSCLCDQYHCVYGAFSLMCNFMRAMSRGWGADELRVLKNIFYVASVKNMLHILGGKSR